MSRNNHQKKNTTITFGSVVTMAMGAFLGIWLFRYLDSNFGMDTISSTLLIYLCLLLLLFVCNYIHTIIHEGGHLLFGLLMGYRFYTFRIGSLIWIKDEGTIKRRKYSLSGTGGQCLMFLPEGEVSKKAHVLYHMGGVILNALTGGLFLLGHRCFSGSVYLSTFLLILGTMGLFNTLLNGIPFRMPLVTNDGHNTLSIVRDPRGEEAFCLQMKITEADAKGTRMKDMPDEWFSIPTKAALQNTMVASTAVLSCFRMMEQQKFIEADYLMEQLLAIESGMVGFHRVLLTCNRIYIETLRENRRDRIQDLLSSQQKKFMKSMRKNPVVLRTEYALALLSDGNHHKAQLIRKEFEALAKVYPYKEDIADEQSLMALVDEKAQIYATIAQRRS